jgi:hypothetical protein
MRRWTVPPVARGIILGVGLGLVCWGLILALVKLLS